MTALSDILAGRRLGLPSWERVVSIVLACQRHAYKTGGVTTDRGTAVLPDWLERWTTAVEAVLASSSEPPTDRDGWDRPAQLEPAHPVEEQMPDRLVPAAWLPVDPTGLHWEPGSQTVQAELVLRVLTSRGMTDLMAFDIHSTDPKFVGTIVRRLRDLAADPDPQSLTTARYQDLFGDHAVDLLTAARDHADVDAASRLGVLLVCGECAGEANDWLETAAAGGDVMAIALLNAPVSYRRGLATEFAYEIAMQEGTQPWEIIPDPDTPAETYGKAAANRGHPGAAYWLGVRHRARHDLEGALHWFSQAHKAGHQHAATDLEEVRAELAARPEPRPWSLRALPPGFRDPYDQER